MDDPPFERDRYPPGEWTPWTRAGAEAWRMTGRMADAVFRIELFTATGYSLKTDFRWEVARIAGDARLLRSGSTGTLTEAIDELADGLWAVYDGLKAEEKRGRDRAKLEAELWSHLIDDLGIPPPCGCNCGCESPSSGEDPETGALLCAECLKTIRLRDGTVACSRAAGRN